MSGIRTPYSGNAVLNPYGPNIASRVNFAFWRQPVYQLSGGPQDGQYWTPGCDGPTYANSPWDYVYIGLPTIGSSITPGIAKVRVDKFRDVDKKKPSGSDGARITIHGVEPAKVEIDLTIWTPEQLRQWSVMWPYLFPVAYKGKPPNYSVSYPSFGSDLYAIKSLTFVKMEGPDIQPDGRGIFRLHAWEYLAPSTKNVTTSITKELGTLYDRSQTHGVETPGSNSANLGP